MKQKKKTKPAKKPKSRYLKYHLTTDDSGEFHERHCRVYMDQNKKIVIGDIVIGRVAAKGLHTLLGNYLAWTRLGK